MPTMKEIAEWLRQAGRDAEQTMPFANEPWEDMANQLEQMHCETCQWFDATLPTECLYPGENYDSDCVEIHWCGPNFCCIHHKFKDTNND